MGATVLLVDDSPLTLEALRAGLQGAGFDVVTASDLEGVPRPLPPEIALVLLDVEMAEAFGDDLAVVLRQDSTTPIHLLSSLDEAELAERAADAGVDGWIAKGNGVAAVVARVEELLGAGTAAHTDFATALRPRFVETAARRIRHVREALRSGKLRRAAYELHAFVGEAAVLGFGDLATLAQDGRRAVLAAHAGDTAALGVCEDALAAIAIGVATLDVATPAPPTAAHRAARNGASVLLLDDSELYRATLRAILEETGYDVVEAGSLAECRALLGTTRCDLAVVDVELPDGSGIDLIPEIRRALPAAPVVVLSGGEVLTVPAGADLVLLKTLDPTTVLTKLERVLATR